jgi:hypothetical protein
MFRSFLRRGVILSGVVCLSLLPLAEAQAVPAERGSGAAASELSWSVEWAEAVRGLLAGFWAKDASETSRAVVEVDPPDGRGDGTGIDPHGGPRPRQSQRPNK